ncbi:hypothetical protein FS749_010389 [Ceratobasidium sp. UAMH 11750]|nr:hypothetical protein FS749_010389 [Ceratobasidium sp. UAMH 11750]
MPDRTPPSTRRYSPYSPPLTRSRSSGSDQVAPALSSSPGPDFPGPDWPVRCRASNVEGESLFELLYKAHSSGNHASRADLVKQMNEIVKEVDEFFNTL